MNREIEKWLDKIATDSVLYDVVIKAYNLGLQDAVDNAELENIKYSDDYVLDKESILKLKL